MSKMLNYLLISGYGWTGSGLLIDILKQNSNFNTIGHEYTLVSEPNGVLDLETHLIENWHFLKCDKAIKDFYKFASKLNKPKSYLHPFGLDLTRNLNIDFMLEINSLIQSLKTFEYQGRSRITSYDKSILQNLYDRLKWRIFDQNKTLMYFSVIEPKNFHELIRNFHDRIFSQKLRGNTLILDQALPFNKINKHENYFNSSKAIIVDRDPKDIYADLIRSGGLIGQELRKMDDKSIDKFVSWYRNQRRMTNIPGSILQIRFEEIINKPLESESKISKYLEKDINIVNYNFEKSRKNIGLWRSLPNHLIENLKEKLEE